MFDFKSAEYDLNLLKSYMLRNFVKEQDTEPVVIRKTNQFLPFKFDHIQLLSLVQFLGGATSLESFLKAYKTSETKDFFPYEWFDYPAKMQKMNRLPNDTFYNKHRNCNPLETKLWIMLNNWNMDWPQNKLL